MKRDRAEGQAEGEEEGGKGEVEGRVEGEGEEHIGRGGDKEQEMHADRVQRNARAVLLS